MPSDRTFVIAGANLPGTKIADTLPEAGRLVLTGAEYGFPRVGVAAVQRGAA
jgi:hypothetical protein